MGSTGLARGLTFHTTWFFVGGTSSKDSAIRYDKPLTSFHVVSTFFTPISSLPSWTRAAHSPVRSLTPAGDTLRRANSARCARDVLWFSARKRRRTVVWFDRDLGPPVPAVAVSMTLTTLLRPCRYSDRFVMRRLHKHFVTAVPVALHDTV